MRSPGVPRRVEQLPRRSRHRYRLPGQVITKQAATAVHGAIVEIFAAKSWTKLELFASQRQNADQVA